VDLLGGNNSQWPIVNSQDEIPHARSSQPGYGKLTIGYRPLAIGGYRLSAIGNRPLPRAATRLENHPPWLAREQPEI